MLKTIKINKINTPRGKNQITFGWKLFVNSLTWDRKQELSIIINKKFSWVIVLLKYMVQTNAA